MFMSLLGECVYVQAICNSVVMCACREAMKLIMGWRMLATSLHMLYLRKLDPAKFEKILPFLLHLQQQQQQQLKPISDVF